MLKFDTESVGIGDPELGRMIGSGFDVAWFEAMFDQATMEGGEIIGFEAKVMNGLFAERFDNAIQKNLNEGAVAGGEVITDAGALAEKVELFFESERIAIKGSGAFEIGGFEANMGEGHYGHGRRFVMAIKMKGDVSLLQ